MKYDRNVPVGAGGVLLVPSIRRNSGLRIHRPQRGGFDFPDHYSVCCSRRRRFHLP